MVDITEISAIVAAVGVLIGVIYYILDIRRQTQIRETDLQIRMNARARALTVCVHRWELVES